MPLDLDPMKEFLEGEMVDTCAVSFDEEGERDDVFDEQSMQYFRKPSDSSILYTGPCLITPEGNLPQTNLVGGGDIIEGLYRLKTPLASPGFSPNSVVTCLSSLRHPGLVGLNFLVVEETFSSWAIVRTHRISRKTRVDPSSAALQPE